MVHCFTEEDNVLHIIDNVLEHSTIKVLADMPDSVLIWLGNGSRVVVDTIPITEPKESRLLELEAKIRTVNLFEKPQMSLVEELIRCVPDSWD
ncbi:hypothetical protein C492_07745 [Natronococcus jeotgali DSM 18795]|uniref:Uncharacterized protein n=1 Tax=Natronococcus jeotgali DSM 18795 TaxID=1227498 RepID=L9XLF6_9EURY|nr:hypothetical protein C492_07745 [Natronococcus jeotgali DSM 18795]